MPQRLLDTGFFQWIILFLCVAVLDLMVAVRCFKKHQVTSGSIFKTMIAAMMTTVFYTGAIAFEGYFASSCFSSLYFAGVDLILMYMLMFVFQFTEEKKFLGRFTKPLFLIGKIWLHLDLAALLINPFWEIVIHYTPVSMEGHTIYKYQPHLLYKLHLALCYGMVFLIVALLVYKMIRTPKIYVRKYRSVLLVFLLDVALNLAYLAGSDVIVLDISVLFYSISGILVYHAVFSSIPKDLLFTTRHFIIENLETPILVFDFEDRMIDSNFAARELFPQLTPEQQNTVDAVDIPRYFLERGFPPFSEEKQVFEWKFRQDSEERVYSCSCRAFRDERGRLIGRMLMMQDISYRKDSITGLDLTPGLYRYITALDKENNYPIQILAVNVNSLGLINSALGHEKGNLVMARAASIVRGVLGKETYMAKLEDGTLIAILLRRDASQAARLADQLRSAAAKDDTLDFHYELEYGVCEVTGSKSDIFDALHEAQISMKNRKLLSDSSHESALINSLLQTLLESDYETKEHVARTKWASKKLAQSMGLSDRETSELALLCMLHDIGKIGIPQEILLKPGKLDADEWEIMKTHTDKGYRIAMASPELKGISRLILHHHERWDGMGYPGRLGGEDIPLLSRIITVLDSFDVMTHDRPYHKAISPEAAKEELLRCSGTQFDPSIVSAFLKIADEVYQAGEAVK